MKVWRTALISLVIVLLAALALLWFLPARCALPWMQARLSGVQLQEVSGLLWDGQAGRVVTTKGENLGVLQWRLSRLAVLGDNRLHVELHGPRVDFVGSMTGKQAAEATWTDVQMRLDLDVLGTGPLVLGTWPRGTLQVSAGRIELRGGWPWSLDTRVQWRNAVLRAPRQADLPLGNLHADLHAVNGVIEGHLQDDGDGPLRVDGRLQLSPLARRFTAVAGARGHHPELQRWLASFGTTDADGTTHINYSGGLAAAIHGEKR
ncbi:type II secretion system protein N [Dyella telluris]|uniref:Type II secretion system protein N n=1 Tax=Dyella telluris TaxID=2763498 RepID=A0A7G8Q0M4_9GAMM|nr:type II secretion system protein N [Dyella telluris]QNK00332.1 type II secretion system protein N [Dyella telluris]